MSNDKRLHQASPSTASHTDAWAIKLARESAFAHSNEHAYLPQTRADTKSWQPHEWVVAAIQVAALGAHQPAAHGEQPYNATGISLTACQLHEALLMAGAPELDVPFEDRGLVRIFWMDVGHSGPGLYCECVDAEEEGCILLDGTAPATRQPAQAVNIAAFKALYRAYVRLLESGRDRIIELGGTCDPVDVMEANDVDLLAARRALEGQVVGNG